MGYDAGEGAGRGRRGCGRDGCRWGAMPDRGPTAAAGRGAGPGHYGCRGGRGAGPGRDGCRGVRCRIGARRLSLGCRAGPGRGAGPGHYGCRGGCDAGSGRDGCRWARCRTGALRLSRGCRAGSGRDGCRGVRCRTEAAAGGAAPDWGATAAGACGAGAEGLSWGWELRCPFSGVRGARKLTEADSNRRNLARGGGVLLRRGRGARPARG